MLAGMSLGTELKRFSRGVMPRIALVTIILMPLLYGAMYLWAFWNPFGEVNKVPVALVNIDRGAMVQGKELNAGDQVSQALLDSGELDLHLVSPAEAAQGVSDGTYYFSLTLPENFSEAVASPTSDNPRKAQLQFAFNDVNNYLATIIGQNAAQQILNQVGATIGAQSVETVLLGLTDAGAGLKQAADGAQQLSAGMTTANDGAAQLASGSKTLADNMVTARDGAATLADGTAQLSAGIDTATGGILALTDGLGQLDVGAGQLGNGATELSGGVTQVVDTLDVLGDTQAQATQLVGQAVAALRLNPDPVSQQIANALAPAQDILRTQGFGESTMGQLAELKSGAQQLAYQLGDPSSTFRAGLSAAVGGGGELRSGLVQLRDGGQQVNAGAQTLSSGLVQLTDGSIELSDGAAQLAEGTPKLQAGASELATKLTEGSGQVPSWTDEQRTAAAQTLSSPVELQETYKNRAATFGTGFAPFFLPLALFVGGIITWMLLKPLQNRPIANGLGALRVVLASYWPALLIGVCQVIVMYVVVHFGVGLHATHVAGTVGFLILITATYMALIQAFNAIFGVSVGRVVTLAFLMLQLVSAGGIYPVETTAKPFQIIHPFDPMTYAVNGLRQLTVGGIDSRLWVSIAVLSGVLIASLTASSLAARRNRQWTMDRLHPPIEV
ncbi:YhgE/Pip domain-containing protein [Rhodococcus sp. AD45-ID]|uniref:YhgE/Pip domain-containing protein n=1 Tax=unclassified Rhodococcus (in: high G+C Gram-positive bacteria) TaxID=192944 RepID=UPI0005D2EF38|nr:MULTISPECIES: YhgE/Pip domain-containing protein [unclassified Rhodococcus (in: high G+C Gram-positive bacteria)]KJF23769.1 inner membrane transport permease [Rhodococcus sp. AD45]PSR42158.1 YhgE/Pip domain-containing protein [Rhodococcus sp. AD45-ID]